MRQATEAFLAAPSLVAALRTESARLGFHRVGIARPVPLDDDFQRWQRFVSQGRHGTMRWLARSPGARLRVDGSEVLSGAQSVIVCAMSYRREVPGEAVGPAGSEIARYARGLDYHGFFRKRVRALAEWVRVQGKGTRARPLVDTAPVLERAWARLAGVGFVGKNGLVIVPGLGSYVLLGEVVTTLALPADEPMTSRCGECDLCLRACPTQAFDAPYELDARRCVSYLTIEHQESVPTELRTGVGSHLFGCDDCQDCCPYNRTTVPDEASTRPFASHERWANMSVSDLLTLSADEVRDLAHGSPLGRAGPTGLARNAAIVMGNSRDRRHLPVLARAAAEHPDAIVREAARWAGDVLGEEPGE